MKKRLIILTSSTAIAFFVVWGLTQISWNQGLSYLAYFALAIVFFGILVSNQQYEEDIFSKIERTVSAFLFSYIIFFRFFYAPLSQFFFGSLITETSFLADLLSLFLFLIFFFLFGTVFLVINTYSRVGFLSRWRYFNNEQIFFILRGLFVSAVAVLILFYLQNSFFSMKYSAYINKIMPSSICNWTYTEYPNFLSQGAVVAGRDACLYNYSQDRKNSGYCNLITDRETQAFCKAYFTVK